MSESSAPSAPPVFVPDWGDEPCPKPVLPAASPEQTAAMMDGVRMRENPAEWAFVRLSKLIEDFEKGLDKDEEIGARIAHELDLALKGEASRGLRARLALERLFCKMSRGVEAGGRGPAPTATRQPGARA